MCAYYLRGQLFRESTRTSDEKEARKFLRARLREVHADEIGARSFTTPRASRLTVAQLLKALGADLALRGVESPQTKSQLKRLEADFGDRIAIAVTSEEIDKYTQRRLADGDSNAYVNRSLTYLAQSYKLAVKRGHLPRQPFITRLSEAGNARQGFVSPADFSKILAALPHDLKDFAQWCYATGTRRGEASKLKWEMVQGNALRIPGNVTKNKKPRELPLVGELAQLVEQRQAQRHVKGELCDYIFHRQGKPVGSFICSWKTATRAAGVPCLFHDLRRSAVRNMSQAGIPQQIAMRVSGHKSASVFQRYNIITSEDVASALVKTEAYRQASAKKTKVVSMP
jgi:integrase